MDYSLLFAIEYTEEELINRKKQNIENRSKSTILTDSSPYDDLNQSVGS